MNDAWEQWERHNRYSLRHGNARQYYGDFSQAEDEVETQEIQETEDQLNVTLQDVATQMQKRLSENKEIGLGTLEKAAIAFLLQYPEALKNAMITAAEAKAVLSKLKQLEEGNKEHLLERLDQEVALAIAEETVTALQKQYYFHDQMLTKVSSVYGRK